MGLSSQLEKAEVRRLLEPSNLELAWPQKVGVGKRGEERKREEKWEEGDRGDWEEKRGSQKGRDQSSQ